MNRKRSLWFLAILPVVGLVWALRSAASWRPQLLGVQPNAAYPYLAPDGRLLLVSDSGSLSGGQIWDVNQKRPLWKTAEVPLMFTWDSQKFLCAHVSSPAGDFYQTLNIARFELRDARSGQLRRAFKNRHPWRTGQPHDSLLDVGFSHDGRELRVATTFHLQRFDASTGQLLQDVKWPTLTNARRGLTEAAFAFDREWLVGFDGCLVFFDAQTGKQLRRLPAVRPSWSDSILAVLPDNTLIREASGNANQARVFQVSNGKVMWHCSDWPIFSWDGQQAFVPTSSGVNVLDAHTGRKLRTLPGPKEYGFEPSPDGNWLYETRNGKIYRWRAR